GQFGVLHEEIGKAQDRGQRIVNLMCHSGHELSNCSQFLGMHQFGLKHRGIGDVANHHHTARDLPLLISYRTWIHRELSCAAIGPHDWQLEIVDLLTGESRPESILDRGAASRGNQIDYRVAKQLLMLIATGLIPAPIGIGDQPGRVGYQDQTLGVVEDLAGEVAFTLQFGLEVLEVGDVEHQAAHLNHAAVDVSNRENVQQYMNDRAVSAPQRLMMIAKYPMLLDQLQEPFAAFRGGIYLGGHLSLEKFFAAAIAQDSHQGIVHLDEAAIGGRKEQSFLNAVDYVRVAPLALTPVSDVLEHMNGLQALVLAGMDPRGRDEICAIQHGLDEVIRTTAAARAQRTRAKRVFWCRGQQHAHGYADDLLWINSDREGQSTIDSQDIVLFVMNDDEIGDGVENLDPVTVRLLHPGEKAGIFE